jgi:hypothetical protein
VGEWVMKAYMASDKSKTVDLETEGDYAGPDSMIMIDGVDEPMIVISCEPKAKRKEKG